MIDISKRFPMTTLREAYERAKDVNPWVFEGLICSSVTTIYGKSKVGKSYLVASMLLSLLIDGREFLGKQPADPTKTWKPVILWTDPDSDNEYGRRLIPELPKDVDVEIPSFYVGRTTKAEEWEALTDHLLTQGYNFVVLDNLMGATGDTNDALAVTSVYDGLTRLTSRGVPVVVLHHESEKGAVVPGASPMGASVVVQKSRAWIQVRQTSRRGLRGGNTALIVESNLLDQPVEIVAEPLQGPDYRVIRSGPWVTRTETAAEKPKREPKTLDRNAAAAEFIVGECQGVGVNKTAAKLSEKFPDRSTSTWRDQLRTGALSKLVIRAGEADSTVWTRT